MADPLCTNCCDMTDADRPTCCLPSRTRFLERDLTGRRRRLVAEDNHRHVVDRRSQRRRAGALLAHEDFLRRAGDLTALALEHDSAFVAASLGVGTQGGERTILEQPDAFAAAQRRRLPRLSELGRAFTRRARRVPFGVREVGDSDQSMVALGLNTIRIACVSCTPNSRPSRRICWSLITVASTTAPSRSASVTTCANAEAGPRASPTNSQHNFKEFRIGRQNLAERAIYHVFGEASPPPLHPNTAWPTDPVRSRPFTSDVRDRSNATDRTAPTAVRCLLLLQERPSLCIATK